MGVWDITGELECMHPVSRVEKSERMGLEDFEQCEESEVNYFKVKATVISESEQNRRSKFTPGPHP